MHKSDSEEDKENWCQEFTKYFTQIDASQIIHISLEIFLQNIQIDKDQLKKYIIFAVGHYNNIPYHNATHGLNVLYSGSIFLKYLSRYNLDNQTKFIFLTCCFLHDINHPGLTEYKSSTLDFEYHHVKYVKESLLRYFPKYITDQNLLLITDLILSTNLIMHEKIISEFKKKYKNYIKKEIGILELKMLIKLADISASYKKYESFICGSKLLEQEIFGKNLLNCKNKLQEDTEFLLKYSLPLAKTFSAIFTEFKFLHDNALENLRILRNQ
ncbi:calcium calmodulin-dependent 3 -cyclic nucleotide phosphodiesterase 1b [Vairimorpha ceranae]|uniref:Calcium calmodulin-dependent 3-cyclic nucleotide phosphodiesterase 1b n=1 Tax=Vairimorpha ceranae TaxID=40302 RepID=A0A0F9Z9Z7_9MICR|nr:calcium calmodulin-dependent 3 -cyclic nucleotide phosphodiesterase 1b [Vairimorpha ceranae]KAF5140511.1 hypothetical protein G9O61_00g013160 [Vairimorpha ceranae]KKO74619.1 calcium calmodulin-dependent 3 -cyclic nucleotide phosphodiesterase 1b [Vairimorpha ceranae]